MDAHRHPWIWQFQPVRGATVSASGTSCWTYPRRVHTVTGRFLLARFASMLVGFLLLVGSFMVFTLFASKIDNNFVRWLSGVASLAFGLWISYALNATVIQRIDPDGAQRQAVRALGQRRERR